jgi:cellulose synthase/poly-beta-1,6-N-acetylglucosamine synthase-like glycosyltransferase
MELISIISLVILVVYSFFIIQLIFGFDKIKAFKPTDLYPKTFFTIIVPFRNEAKNLPKLLESFSNLNYPHQLIEIIMVDDFSTDNSERICLQWRVKNDYLDTTLLENLLLSNSPKKDALGRAIPIAKHDWIITTDADCTVQQNWLLTLDNYIQTNQPEMIVGAVLYKTKNNWFHHFQQLDLMSLQGVTVGSFGIGTPFMCNGANLAYTKKLFLKLDGFNGNNNMASGDDVFLLQKAVNFNLDNVHYLKNKDFIVTTKPENDLFKLFIQRVRWASKTSGYNSNYAKFLAITVLLMNLNLLVSFGLLVSGYLDWQFLLIVFIIKYVVDYILLFKSNRYLRKGKFLMPIASSIVYPLFSSLVGIYSLFGSFNWKGRTFKK